MMETMAADEQCIEEVFLVMQRQVELYLKYEDDDSS
jgi:hypothetical protein